MFCERGCEGNALLQGDGENVFLKGGNERATQINLNSFKSVVMFNYDVRKK